MLDGFATGGHRAHRANGEKVSLFRFLLGGARGKLAFFPHACAGELRKRWRGLPTGENERGQRCVDRSVAIKKHPHNAHDSGDEQERGGEDEKASAADIARVLALGLRILLDEGVGFGGCGRCRLRNRQTWWRARQRLRLRHGRVGGNRRDRSGFFRDLAFNPREVFAEECLLAMKVGEAVAHAKGFFVSRRAEEKSQNKKRRALGRGADESELVECVLRRCSPCDEPCRTRPCRP